MKNDKHHPNKKIVLGTFITQPISQADSRQKDTGVPIPNDENVAINRKWIEENKK